MAPTSLGEKPKSSPSPSRPYVICLSPPYFHLFLLSPLLTLLQPHGPPHCSSNTLGQSCRRTFALAVSSGGNALPPDPHMAPPSFPFSLYLKVTSSTSLSSPLYLKCSPYSYLFPLFSFIFPISTDDQVICMICLAFILLSVFSLLAPWGQEFLSGLFARSSGSRTGRVQQGTVNGPNPATHLFWCGPRAKKVFTCLCGWGKKTKE